MHRVLKEEWGCSHLMKVVRVAGRSAPYVSPGLTEFASPKAVTHRFPCWDKFWLMHWCRLCYAYYETEAVGKAWETFKSKYKLAQCCNHLGTQWGHIIAWFVLFSVCIWYASNSSLMSHPLEILLLLIIELNYWYTGSDQRSVKPSNYVLMKEMVMRSICHFQN